MEKGQRNRVEEERYKGVKEGARERERGVERSYGRFAACRVVVACRASSKQCRTSSSFLSVAAAVVPDGSLIQVFRSARVAFRSVSFCFGTTSIRCNVRRAGLNWIKYTYLRTCPEDY